MPHKYSTDTGTSKQNSGKVTYIICVCVLYMYTVYVYCVYTVFVYCVCIFVYLYMSVVYCLLYI